MEDIAEENINQLVDQGMIRVKIGLRNELEVVEPYYKICLLKLQQGEPIKWYRGDSDYNLPECARIVLVHYRGETITTSFNDNPIVSLFVIKARGAIVPLKSLPEEIGDLINLRYLGLKHSALDEIPESICNLLNLQTLDIRWPMRLRVLPSGILKLVQLRHLMLSMNEIKVPSGIDILTNLQSLTNLFIRPGIIQELRSLTQLKKLKFMDVSEEHDSELSACIMKMTGLVSLSLDTTGYEDDELLPTLESFSPPPSFRKLRLYGRLMDLPNWVCSMENLTKLTLGYSFLSEEAIYVLQFLPNLKHLALWEACKVKVINKEFCQVGGFPKLEALLIANQNLLEWTEIEDGALPSLAFLKFHCCSQLRILPKGLQCVTTLKVLNMFPLHPDLKREANT
ncbi:disease resistance protein RPM1-like [Macadamia integrifolia]|uniref:disease resistance protein RPM1-like n=1 Tax=Macadamia integrifolia TaxID=60698 RepID=UPI001C4FFE22|nr:disease resistance protein RPM1-like [Macadamia integrifolia]